VFLAKYNYLRIMLHVNSLTLWILTLVLEFQVQEIF